MADNVNITAGSGTTIAADDIGGVLHQRVKLSQGADGSATDVSSSDPLNVTLANTGANATPLVVDLGANNDVSLNSGTNYVGKTRLTDGTTDAEVVPLTGYNAQAVAIMDASGNQITSFGGGTQYTEGDTDASVTGTAMMFETNTGTSALGVVSSTNPLPISDNGGSITVDGTVTITPSGTQTVSGTVAVSTINSVAPAFGSGVRGATVQRVTIATDDSVPVTGTFWQATQPVSGTVTANAGTGTMAVSMATNTPVGTVAHDSADSGAPIKVGGRARSSEITAVANDDRTDLVTDLASKLITMPYANNENFVSGAITTSMTGTTSTSLVAAPGAGLRNYITTIIVSNAHATVGTDVIIQDGSGGTTLLTIPAAAVYGGAVINLPVPLRQPTTNTAIYCANVTTGASTKVSAVGYKGY